MNAFSLESRHVVVTGAGRGLGRGIALACAAAGATVTLVARTATQLEGVAAEICSVGGDARALSADLGSPDGVAQVAERLDADIPVDGVVHAAGVQVREDALNFDPAALRRVLALNLEAPFLLTREIARRQIASGRPGSHVFIGSLGSSLAIPRAVAYTASKSGLLGVARTLSHEWAPDGIRVNVLSPGYFRTELTADLLADPDEERRLLSRIPMRRLGAPADVGTPAVFLLSDASSYITGQNLSVDGGWLAS